MSQQDTIFGCINVSSGVDADEDAVARTIASLPERDSFPPLCRSMLTIAGTDVAEASFRGDRSIAFAFMGNHASTSLREFLPKLEALLMKLPWYSAMVCVRPEYGAAFDVEYTLAGPRDREVTHATPWEIRCYSRAAREPVLHTDVATRPGFVTCEKGQSSATHREAAAALLDSVDWLLAFSRVNNAAEVHGNQVLRRALRDALRECHERACTLEKVSGGHKELESKRLFEALVRDVGVRTADANAWVKVWRWALKEVEKIRDELATSSGL